MSTRWRRRWHRRPNSLSAISGFLREQNIYIPNQSRSARRQREEAAAEEEAPIAETAQASTSSATEASTSTAAAKNSISLASTSRKATKKRKKMDDSSSESDTDDDSTFIPKSSSRSKKPASNRKKVIPRINQNVKYKAVSVPSLQDVCISTIAENIEDVEDFGFISEDNLDKLANIISKNRKMSDEISRLFMQPMARRLRLYDCTKMTDTSLLNIAQFCPKLQELHLSYCGQMSDRVIEGYGDRLYDLKSLRLSGPYRIRKEAWIKYFNQLDKSMETFELRYTSRFDLACVQALVESCFHLTTLKFGHITAMDSSWLSDIAKLKELTSLEFAWPDSDDAIRTEHVVDYLAKFGPSLKHLSLKGGINLNDKIFTGLNHCKRLESLHIEKASKLTAKGMVTFLKHWDNPGLHELDIGRCSLFDDKVITELVQHSGASLIKLNIHSLHRVTFKGLERLAGDDFIGCKALQEFNCSFVRSMDDYVLAKMIKECSALCKIEAWGCHELTDGIKCNEKLLIIGRELLDKSA